MVLNCLEPPTYCEDPFGWEEQDKETIASIMEEKNINYWEAVRYCLKYDMLYDYFVYKHCLEYHEEQVRKSQWIRKIFKTGKAREQEILDKITELYNF
jgi:hypothetical protein